MVNPPHRSKLKRSRYNHASTTLQFAPPRWVSKLFSRNPSTLSLPQENYGRRSWLRVYIFEKLVPAISSVPYLLPKLLYIWLMAGMGSVVPFLPIFYNSSLALTSSEIGVVFSIAPFISALSCPLWTGLADKFQKHRFIIVFTYSMATLSVIAQMILPRASPGEPNDKHGPVLIGVLLAALWFAFFGIPVNALVDSGVLKILGDNKELYGQQRLWGSISYGLGTFLVGLLLNTFNSVDVIFIVFIGTAVLFLICAASTDFNSDGNNRDDLISPRHKDIPFKPLIDLEDDDSNRASGSRTNNHIDNDNSPVIYLAPQTEEGSDDSSAEEDEDEEAEGVSVPDLDLLVFPPTAPNIPADSFATNSSSSVMILITNPSVAILLLVMLLMGTALAVSNFFLLLFLSRDLRASSTVIGLTGPMSATTELLFFFYSRELIVHLGITRLIILAHVATIIRALTYIFLKPTLFSHIIALLIQLLNGIAFSSLWTSGVTHLTNLAPSNLVSLSQGLMSAVFAGVGTGLGSLVGGFVYDRFGYKAMFGVVDVIAFVSLAIYLWREGTTPGQHRGNGKKPFRHRGFNDLDESISSLLETNPPRSVLTVERTKKADYELLPQDEDEQYRFGVFGENAF